MGGESFDDGKVGEDVGRDGVALLEIWEGVVGDPDFALSIFPDEEFEGKVDGGGGGGEHDGSATFGIAEDEEVGGAHGEAGFCGFAAVVDEGKDGDMVGVEDGFEFGGGVVNGVTAGDAN